MEPSPSNDARSTFARALPPTLVALAVIAGLWLIGRSGVTSSLRNAGPVPFFAATAVLPALGVPITPLMLLAGALFGHWVGLGGAWLALAANLVLCYWLAHRGLRTVIVRWLERSGKDLPHFEPGGQGALRFTLAVKFAPGLPAFAKNYVLGVAGVPFAVYFAASMIVTGGYVAALVLFGESLFQHPRVRIAVVVAVAIGLLVFGCVWLARRGRTDRRGPLRA